MHCDRLDLLADEAYPLFMASKDWLWALDSTLEGERFFEESEDRADAFDEEAEVG